MGSAYTAGLRIALRRRPVVLILFLANLGSGIGFTAASWLWLDGALDKSLATRTLLTDLDMNVFVDLFVYHAEGLQMLAIGGVVLAVLTALLWVWLNAVAVIAVAEDGTLSDWIRRGVSVYPTFFRLWVLATVVDAISVLMAVMLGRWLVRLTAESPSEMTFYWVVAAAATLGAVLLLFFSTVHDHARIHSAATERGAVRAFGWALGFVGRSQLRALPLAIALLVSGGVVWLVYQTVGMLIPPTSSVGVVVSLLWGEAFLVARTLLRLWNFAAATELQGITESSAT